ncbi:MAG TPA: hypothetical protein VE570_15365 [Thermoleophilaceae bacterium]|nr:hypothetical protein [Thermoleophilaceae bacterium]
MSVRREIDIEARPEEVWEAISTEEGRERWLADDRDVLVEVVEAPNRLVWWWPDESEDAFTRVEVEIVAVPAGSRVVVVESAPTFPLTMLAAGFAPVAA